MTTTPARHVLDHGSVATTPAGPSPLRVLCVDDNRDAADTLGLVLRLYGADVTVCHGGREALTATAGQSPDVAVLDVNMPEMDGCELARRLRARSGSRPLLIAAVTAMDGHDAYSREADAGFDLHFTKPVSPTDLIDALAEFVRRRDDERSDN